MNIDLQGQTAPGFEPVQSAFRRLWDDVEIGASLSVYKDGEEVVSLWGGYKDRDQADPWQQDTLVCIYSTTKAITALALACLVDEGIVDYDRPVIDYWPQFGAERKFDITVAQLLSHQAGLYQFDPPVTVEDLYDFQAMTFNLASQEPAWEPGSAFGYHSVTWGYLAGEIIRQVTGVSPGDYINTRIAEPLQADFYLGVPDAMHDRCATLIGPNHARKEMPEREKPAFKRALKNTDPVITPFRDVSSAAWRRAEIPASSGHASANGLAKIFSAALSGRLLSAETLALATTPVTNGEVDLLLGQPLKRGMGFIVNCDDVWFGPNASAFGHTGTGGSVVFADKENGIAFAYVMNQLHTSGGLRSRQLIEALYQCI